MNNQKKSEYMSSTCPQRRNPHIKRCYQINQPTDSVNLADSTHSKKPTRITDESEFDSNGPFTFKYYIPRSPVWAHFQDKIAHKRDRNLESFNESGSNDYLGSNYTPGKIVTTEIVPGDLFKLAEKPGIWKFVGLSDETITGKKKVVFKAFDSEARQPHSNSPHPTYVTKYKGDFSHKFSPFTTESGDADGHRRIGTRNNKPPLSIKRPDHDHRANKDIAAPPKRPDPDRGPMYPTGVTLKTYDHVPQSLRNRL